jgi:hypothetical protein
MFNFRYNPKIVFVPSNFDKYFNTPLGRKIYEFLKMEEVVKRMSYFVDARVTPVEGIDEEIDIKFGKDLRKLNRIEFDKFKQMIGKIIRSILEAHGYEHYGYGYKVRSGKIFVLASKYKKK